MPRITISYRRADSQAVTGRIFDRLIAHYGRQAVFRDIDNIPLGADFRSHIAAVMDASDIILVVVGPRWIGGRSGQGRLAEPTDPVRIEVETALAKGIPVIPILVKRTGMPRLDQLPESLHAFAYRNGLRIDSGQDFDSHVDRLIRAMDGLLGGPPPVDVEAPQPVTPADLAGAPSAPVAEPAAALVAEPVPVAEPRPAPAPAAEAAPAPRSATGARQQAAPRGRPSLGIRLVLGVVAGALASLVNVFGDILVIIAINGRYIAPPAIYIVRIILIRAVWGLVFVLYERLLVRLSNGGYWIGVLLFGGAITALVGWFIITPMFGGSLALLSRYPALLVVTPLVDAIWAVVTALLLRLMHGRPGGRMG